MICLTENDIDAKIRATDWQAEYEAAQRRYHSTPRWRFFRRNIHVKAMESALWFLTQQEAGRL